MAGRQIAVTKSLRDFPVSAMMKEPYVMNEQAPKPLKTKLDTTKTPVKGGGLPEVRDFAKYTKVNPLTGTQLSRIPIKPLTSAEKAGPKFGVGRD